MKIDLLGAKAIAGAVSGVILTVLTHILAQAVGSPIKDYVLVIAFITLYFAFIPFIKRLTEERKKILTKGISVFYSVEFICWIITYELIYRLTTGFT